MQRRHVPHISCRLVALCIALLMLPAGTSHAQTTAEAAPTRTSVLDDPFVRQQAKQGLDLLYNMKFEEARRIFERVDQRYPRHPIGPFLKALNTWWTILIDFSDTSHDEAFYDAMDEVIDRSNRMLKRDEDAFDATFFKGAALGFRGRLRSNRHDWFKAAMDGKRALSYVFDVAEADTTNPDFVFGKGIYDYFAKAVPEKYPVVKPMMIFFPDGDKKRGIRELQRVAEDGYYIQTEAAYFLLQIYYFYEKNFAGSLRYVTWLREHHPDNAYFHVFEGRVQARWGYWNEAQPIFEEVLQRYQQNKPGYNEAIAEQALYYLARSRMVFDDYEEALSHLLRLEALAARNDVETYYKVMGRLRQGMAYDALGNRSVAVMRYREVLDMEDHGNAHEWARRYLDHPYTG